MQTQDKKKGASKINQLLKQFNDIIVLVVDHARSVECDQARERGTRQNKSIRTTASMHANKKKERKNKNSHHTASHYYLFPFLPLFFR